MNRVIYTGLFVLDKKSFLEKYPPVHVNVFSHHLTISFRPKDGAEGISVGKKYPVKIIGRVTADDVDALLLDCKKSNNKHPHITLSTAEGIKPFASNEAIKKAIANGKVIPTSGEILMVEGYFNGKRDVVE